MKKILFFLIFTILLFAGIAYLSNVQKEKALEGNPYGTDNLDAATIEQLDDPNYQNIILPDELKTKLEAKEDVTVYFFSPTCSYCRQTTPILMPLAKDLEATVVQYNLLEFEKGWDDYHIESTPTLVQYKEGKEVNRITGYQEKETFSQWLKENSLSN